jgi:hypothetical protein
MLASYVAADDGEIARHLCDIVYENDGSSYGEVSMKCYENIVSSFSDVGAIVDMCNRSAFYKENCYTIAARAEWYRNETNAVKVCRFGGDMCFNELSRISNDWRFCVYMNDNSSCLSRIVSVKAGENVSAAVELSRELNCCRFDIAYVLSERGDGRSIEFCNDSFECLWRIMPNLGLIDKNLAYSFCDGLPGMQRDDCILEVVKKIDDTEFSLNLCNTSGFRYACYTNVAVARNNPEICGKIENEQYRRLCGINFK